MSMNKCYLHGNVGQDPQSKTLPDGKMLCRFSIATTETWKNQAGEKQSKTEWHNIAAWGKQAEAISKFVKKGSELLIEGKIEYTQDKDDPKKKYTNIRLITFNFCGKKGSGGGSTPDPEYSGPEYGSDSQTPDMDEPNASSPAPSTFPDDDIPF